MQWLIFVEILQCHLVVWFHRCKSRNSLFVQHDRETSKVPVWFFLLLCTEHQNRSLVVDQRQKLDAFYWRRHDKYFHVFSGWKEKSFVDRFRVCERFFTSDSVWKFLPQYWQGFKRNRRVGYAKNEIQQDFRFLLSLSTTHLWNSHHHHPFDSSELKSLIEMTFILT